MAENLPCWAEPLKILQKSETFELNFCLLPKHEEKCFCPLVLHSSNQNILIRYFLVILDCCTEQAEGSTGPEEQLCRWHWCGVRLTLAGNCVSGNTNLARTGQPSCQLGGDQGDNVLGVFWSWKKSYLLCYPSNTHLGLQSLHIEWKSTFFYWFCSPEFCPTNVNYQMHPFFQPEDQQSIHTP